jgi:class 3 adenylate cyclase
MTQATRRLAAILSADVAGYSRLMGDDEPRTLAALAECHHIFRRHFDASNGRVVDTAGDSVLGVFDSETDAVLCAVATQKDLAQWNEPRVAEQRMLFRVGIHLGDVFVQADGRVYGDGVNVAARLQALAEPGGICVSEMVRAAVGNKLPAVFESLGEQHLKNIAVPISVYRRMGRGRGSAAWPLREADSIRWYSPYALRAVRRDTGTGGCRGGCTRTGQDPPRRARHARRGAPRRVPGIEFGGCRGRGLGAAGHLGPRRATRERANCAVSGERSRTYGQMPRGDRGGRARVGGQATGRYCAAHYRAAAADGGPAGREPEGLARNVCREFSGTNRFSTGHSHCLTFPDPKLAIAAVERLAEEWRACDHREGWRCPMSVAVYKAVLYAYRDFIYSSDLNVAALVERSASRMPPGGTIVLVTGQVRRDLVGTRWDERIERIDVKPGVRQLANIEIYRLGKRDSNSDC